MLIDASSQYLISPVYATLPSQTPAWHSGSKVATISSMWQPTGYPVAKLRRASKLIPMLGKNVGARVLCTIRQSYFVTWKWSPLKNVFKVKSPNIIQHHFVTVWQDWKECMQVHSSHDWNFLPRISMIVQWLVLKIQSRVRCCIPSALGKSGGLWCGSSESFWGEV